MGLQKLANLDFRSLTVEQSKLYNKIVPDIQHIFNRIIGNIYEKNNNNYNWYFSSLASRNPHQSHLFERLCKIRLLEIILTQNDSLEVFVDDFCLYRFILKNLKKESLNVVFVGNNKSRIRILTIILYRYLNYIAIILCKWALSSFHRLNFIRGKELFLIDTFVYSGSDGQGTINDGFYNDRYFPNLIEHASSKIDFEILYVPTLLIDKSFLPSYLKLLKQENFLPKEPFLNAKDWLNLIILPLRKINLKNVNLKVRDYNISDFIKDELLFNRFSITKLISGINYNFIKRLKYRNISIKGFIEWYENQVIDRGMILGLRKHFPDVKVCAYQGFVICPIYNFYLSPTEYEDDHLLTPHMIAVTGDCLLETPKKHYNIHTIVAPAFRFQHLYKPFEQPIEKNKIKILIPFSICLNTSLENLKMLYNAVEKTADPNKYDIIVNLHPAVKTAKIRNDLQKDFTKIVISDQSFYFNVMRSNLLVGSTSSACVEALVYGLDIMIIGSRTGITSNPIPHKYIDKCKVVYSSYDLKNQIENFSKKKPFTSTNKDEILYDCFSKVDRCSVHNFIENTLN